MAYFFLVERGPRPGLQLSVATGRTLVLGRGSTVDLPLPAEDRSISRRHAEISADATSLHIKPLSNSGLTLVNGIAITSITGLSPGDTVQVGETQLRLFTDTSPSPDDDVEPLSLRDVVQSVRARRSEPNRPSRVVTPSSASTGSVKVTGAVFVEPDAERLRCTGCGDAGIVPPRPDLWDAAWLCARCAQSRRENLPGLPWRLGNYDVLRPLAHGGMGIVYEGVARDNGLHVAIKVLRLARGASDRIVQRFAREQQITMALRHPNIVCCYDVGTWEGSLYIASEFVSGGDALTISSSSSPLQQVLWLGADLFRALGYGHDLGIVHRDVKPANLLLCPIGPEATLRGKLADFGLAKSSTGVGGAITMSNESGGSLLTIGPEQLEDFVNIGPSADLYAAGATLFWMLTGDTPLVLPATTSAATFEQKAMAIVDRRRKLLRDLRPDVPDQVASLVDGLVAHDPAMRNGMHAREVAVALNAIAARLGHRNPKAAGLNEKPPSIEEPAPAYFKDALETVEVCVSMLEGSVERAARAVREAVASEDAARVDRAVADHEVAQADLENALARWEKLVETVV